LPDYWSGSPTCADVLQPAFVLDNARVSCLFSRFSPDRRQPLPTEALSKSLRIFRFSKAEHHEVAVIAAQGVRKQRCRQGRHRGKYHLTVLEVAHLCGGSSPYRHQPVARHLEFRRPSSIAVTSSGASMTPTRKTALAAILKTFQMIGFDGSGLFAMQPVSAGRYVGSIHLTEPRPFV
jgi:hypothetical protein